MNTPRVLAAMLWAPAALLAVAAAQAGGGIHRCQTADGMAVYTDTACAALHARPTPMPTALLNRLSNDPGIDEASLGLQQYARVIPPRRGAESGCARDPGQLSVDLLGAFALGDVNRIAESFHWPGLQHQQAQVVMQRLQTLARRPLVDASFWPGLDADGDVGGAMQLTFQAPQYVVELGVERYSGCYFVHF